MSEYVGLDVSLEETSVCILNTEGSIIFEGKVASDPSSIEVLLKQLPAHQQLCGPEACPEIGDSAPIIAALVRRLRFPAAQVRLMSHWRTVTEITNFQFRDHFKDNGTL